MIRAVLLLRSLCSVHTYDGDDSVTLLLQHASVEDDGFQSTDDLSALQAAGAPRAPLAETFKVNAQEVEPHRYERTDETKKLPVGLLEVGAEMSRDSRSYRSVARSDVPRFGSNAAPEERTVSVLQGGIKLPVDEPVMTICNAYAFPEPLDIKLLRTGERILSGLTYKDCVDLVDMALEVGDDLEFTARDSPLGVFHVAGIPQGGAQLLLVPHRRHGDSYVMKFESHAFRRAEFQQPMIATIDAYQGESPSFVRLVQDSIEAENAIRVENITYGTVSVVTVGSFQVQLVRAEGLRGYTNVTTHLGRNYVVLRVGGGNYPEEMVVYPKDSSAWRLGLSSLAALLAVLAHV